MIQFTMKSTTYYTEHSNNNTYFVKDTSHHILNNKFKNIRKFSRTWNSKNTRCVYTKQHVIV